MRQMGFRSTRTAAHPLHRSACPEDHRSFPDGSLHLEHPKILVQENHPERERPVGSDSFQTRYAIADAAEKAKIPMVMAAVGRFDGSVTVFMPYIAGNPNIYDLYPEAPPDGLLPSCAEAGIIGALTGVIGTLQAMEAIKLIAGIGEPLVGRLLLYDGLNARFEEIAYSEG